MENPLLVKLRRLARLWGLKDSAAFRAVIDRRWIRFLALLIAIIGLWDLIGAQLVSAAIGRDWPRIYDIVVMTGSLLPWWGWFLILFGIIVIASVGYLGKQLAEIRASQLPIDDLNRQIGTLDRRLTSISNEVGSLRTMIEGLDLDGKIARLDAIDKCLIASQRLRTLDYTIRPIDRLLEGSNLENLEIYFHRTRRFIKDWMIEQNALQSLFESALKTEGIMPESRAKDEAERRNRCIIKLEALRSRLIEVRQKVKDQTTLQDDGAR